MQIVAKVINLEISDTDLAREMRCGGDWAQALRRLIDRCLLLVKAMESGFSVSDEEFDIAMMELLDEEEPFGLPAGSLQDLDALEMETLLKRNIIIKKYLNSIYPAYPEISEDKLRELYLEQQDSFCCDEMVRCSHILISGEGAYDKAMAIRNKIHSPEDFVKFCRECSDCPSNECCGDLGFFPKGKLFPEIDQVAFALNLYQISDPFPTSEGYHILMLTDRKQSQPVPFEEIHSSLAQHILQMEREYFLMRHLSELYNEYKSQILILTDAKQQA
ncbi:MAG TPA: peptidylprolyl isomerase [Candidatus Cloacimonadota bacterium]|nr:peptidylprolyl isomerase [Candidatus Cloacimonadota bacterium]